MYGLQGINFLKENIIEGKSCNLSAPFAFISYAHDSYDTKVVRNVFDRLYEEGYNLWIDTANIPKNENSWKTAAQEALIGVDKCKLALFFRSEESLIREPIFEELEILKIMPHIKRIVVIDIWHNDSMTADKYKIDLLKNKRIDEFNIYNKICKIVDIDSSVIRIQDVSGSLDGLIEKIGSELKKDGVLPIKKDVDHGVPTSPDSSKQTPFRKNEVQSDLELFEKRRSVSQFNRIALKEFLQKYNNNNFKKDTFSKLRLVGSDGYEKYNTEFHDSAYDLVWEFVMYLLNEKGIEFINSVEEKHPGLKNPAFITQDIYEKRNDQKKYRKIEAEGLDNYYMYRHYGQYQWMDTVLKLRMLDFGLPIEKFYIEYVNENEQLIDVTDEIDIEDGENETDSFIYTLWNEPHTANKLASMMHDVFELIAVKYPEKIKEMAEDISITSVALKSDVDEEKLPPNKLNYFKAKKEHKVGDTLYYVSTRYNRKGGIGQLRKMLALCEGNSDSLKITSSPEKSTRSNNGKTGIGELLD